MLKPLWQFLPNVDGIIGFPTLRHLHWVVYQPKALLWGATVGTQTIHILQLILLVQTMGIFWDNGHKTPQKISRDATLFLTIMPALKGTGPLFSMIYQIYHISNQIYLDVLLFDRKEEAQRLFLTQEAAGWWHQLLSIIAMLSSLESRDWMRHEEVIQGDKDSTTQRLYTLNGT